MEQEIHQVKIDPSTELKAVLNEIVKTLAGMSKEEHLAWFKHTMYVQPLTFSKEIDGTTYLVRSLFDEDASENIVKKAQRLIMKNPPLEIEAEQQL